MIVLLLIACSSFPALRVYARHVERSRGEAVDKVHRLRRAVLTYALLAVPLMAAGTLELRYEREHLGPGIAVAALVTWPLAIIGALVGAQLAIRPAYERLRRTEGTTRAVSRRLVRALAVLLAPQLVWLGLFLWLRRAHAHPALLAALAVAFVLSLAVGGPYVLRAAVPSRTPSAADAERMAAICTAHGVTIDGVRVLDTQHDPMANAAFSGFGPGPKYLFVTDRLLQDFPDDELEAVMAHEIGHRRKHHIAIKLAAVLGAVVVLGAAMGGVSQLVDGPAVKVVALAFPLVIVVSMLLVQGWVGIRLERQADDYAASTVGPEALHAALSRMAELNMMRRHTAWLWNVLQQHPGLDGRLDRLAAHTGNPRP